MHDWVDGPRPREYSLSADWDDRWRTGGTLDEVIAEAHLDPATSSKGSGGSSPSARWAAGCAPG